jgi:hydrogenase maturation protein HypF
MENYETLKFFEESFENLKAVYRVDPVAVVHDLHPGYLSTQWARDYSALRTPHFTLKRIAIQHHYAHIGSVMAEQGLEGPVIGVAFDGTGYGTDGNLWGGEFLIAGIDGFERVGQFKYVPLPGGEAAIREPWKTAVSYIVDAAGGKAWGLLERAGFLQRYGEKSVEQVMIVARSHDFSPLSSGAGRLFDAVSAVIGVCGRNTFEGEAAMALEAIVLAGIDDEYPVEFKEENGYTVADFSPAIIGIIDDLSRSVPKEISASKFHNTVASVIRTMVSGLGKSYGIKDVALSGGTFQNRYLLNKTVKTLTLDGMSVHTNKQVPCNDGGISLGQAYLARERIRKCGMRSIR